MSTKEEHTGASYELIYWPNIPGRGEFVRLALEATGTPYKDICNQQEDGIQELIGLTSPTNSSGYPLFAPPILRVTGTGKYHVGENGDDPLIIHQTPNILIYLAGKIGLEGGDRDANQVIARQIMLTAFDLNNEAHDTHHPVTVMEHYEEQKDVALRRAIDFRKNRIPKFFAYFERALGANKIDERGKYFAGERLSVADIAVWQVLDGLKFAFPKELAAREKDFPLLYGVFYHSFTERVGTKEYLASDRRLKYSNGIFRHYPELDRQE